MEPSKIARKDLPHARDNTGKGVRRQGVPTNRYGVVASRVIAPHMIEELLETYQMWEERERKTNLLMITYWLIALHLYPTLSEPQSLWENGQWSSNDTR